MENASLNDHCIFNRMRLDDATQFSCAESAVRQSWNKYNLYNLSRTTNPNVANKTFFQQKWLAKSLGRGYHNPYVREGQWTRMFDRRLPAVVPMDYKYLAKYDGSELASGRGSGEEKIPRWAEGAVNRTDRRANDKQKHTPYMSMTFHPLERRLDTAIFRALFASSTKQARQFVIHGGVTVNGKKMTFPGYQLNPGDMFAVNPEMVLFGTGAKKAKKSSPASVRDLMDAREEKAAERRRQEMGEPAAKDEGGSEASSSAEQDSTSSKPEDQSDPKEALQALMKRARRILDDSKREISGKRQRDLREFTRSVRKTLSKLRGVPEDSIEDTVGGLETGLAEILTKIPEDSLAVSEKAARQLGSAPAAEETDPQATAAAATSSAPTTTTTSSPGSSTPGRNDAQRARKDAEMLHAALERARENPRDARKPYATPWRPRDFMSAFAFIPRYLEVNQNICSAVYLRHPVARPGIAEVPSPYSGETLGLAFNWYLRRR